MTKVLDVCESVVKVLDVCESAVKVLDVCESVVKVLDVCELIGESMREGGGRDPDPFYTPY